MKNPKANQRVKYVGGFPEFENQTYIIAFVYPNGNDIDVIGEKDFQMVKKSRVDFELIVP
jgi:hypothetical protein